MQPTRIKICGITRPSDAVAAAEAGASLIGMVLFGQSKRLIQLEQARKIVEALPPSVGAVGLFVDAQTHFIHDAAKALDLKAVQLHGNESPKIVESLAPLPVIKAVRVDAHLNHSLSHWRNVHLYGLLLDSAAGGGSGHVNDWDAIAAADLTGLPPLIIAGGLNPSNVGEVVLRFRPMMVDVSSGVETAPGEKSAELIRQFVNAVRDADRAIESLG
jgi:phosphoribosylanthranilate isomerase